MIYADFENKPLPEHTRLDYHECLAKIVLETMFPSHFMDLELKDKPDLQNIEKQVGVEVTSSINPIQERNEGLCTKIAYGQIRNKEKAIEIINSSYEPRSIMINGKEIREPERYCNGILVGIPGRDSFDLIYKAFKQKVYKLNKGGYRIFLHNTLFVHSDILTNQDMIDEVIIQMNAFQAKYESKFQKIFVYVPAYLYILNLMDKTGEIKFIKEDQYDWDVQAREMVIKYEIEHKK